MCRCNSTLSAVVKCTTMQPLLSAVVKAHFSLSGYIVQMPDRTNAKILTASLLGERTGRDRQDALVPHDEDYPAKHEI